MSKRTVRLTESELKNIITESVKNIISELDWKTYANAARKSRERGDDWTRASKFNHGANKAFRDKYGLRKLKNNGYDLKSDFIADVPYAELDSPDERGYIAYGDREKPFTKNVGSVYANYDIPTDEYDKPGLERVGDDVFGAQKDLEDYRYGNYDYTQGKGWHLKDNK